MVRGGKWKASTELRRWRSLIGCYLTRPEERESSWLKTRMENCVDVYEYKRHCSNLIKRYLAARESARPVKFFYFIAGTKSKFTIKIISYLCIFVRVTV